MTSLSYTAINKTIFQNKIIIALLILILISTYLLFGGYYCISILLTTLVLGSVHSASYSSMKRLKFSRCPDLNERTVTESKNWVLQKNFESSEIQKQPPEVFRKKSFLRHFAKSTGKHLCLRVFFNKKSHFN